MLGKVAHESQMPLSLVTHGEKSLVLIPASTLFATRRILLSRCDFWIVFFYLNFHQNVLIFLLQLSKAVKN